MRTQHQNFDQQIVFLRFLAIILILFHHSTTVFDGWPPSDLATLGLNSHMAMLSSFAKSYGLGIFTFISGYLIALSGRKKLGLRVVWHKMKKILGPCIIAAVIYYIWFSDFSYNGDPVNGTHLWYLPMIFILYFLAPFINSSSPMKFAAGVSVFFVVSFILYRITGIRTFNECTHYIGLFVCGSVFCRVVKHKPNIGIEKIILVSIVFAITMLKDLKSNISVVIMVSCLYYFLKALKERKVKRQGIAWRLSSTIIRQISNKSYFIYIVHQFVIDLCIMLIPIDTPYFKTTMIVACFTLSIIVPLALDYAMNKLKRFIQ